MNNSIESLNQNSKIQAMALGLFAVALWAGIPAFVKIGSTVESLPFLILLRFSIASIFFLKLAPKIFRKIKQVGWFSVFTLSACLGANFYFQGLAMVSLPVSWYLIIFCLNPLFALILLGTKINMRLLLGIGASMLGTLLFININEIRTNYGLLPIVYIFIGMITWVLYTVLAKRFQKVYSSTEFTGLTQFAALFASLIIWITSGLPTMSLSTNSLMSVVALGALTPLAYFSFNSCLRASPQFGIVSQYLEPVFGIAIGICFFGEALSLVQIVGSALIIMGSVTMES